MRAALAALATALALAAGGCGSEPPQPAAGGADPSFFGVAPQEPPNDAEFARMGRGGVGSYHLFISWARVERTEGDYDWSLYDALFTQIAANGIEPIPYLFGTSPVYEDDPTTPPVRDRESFDAWADFVEAAVSRYGPGGELWTQLAESDPEIEPAPPGVWEIWNEMNGPAFWAPAPDVDEYAALLKRSARVITGVDPEARIMTGGMFATPPAEEAIESFEYLRELFRKRGVEEIVDVVGVHPYGPRIRDVRSQLTRTRAATDGGEADPSLFVTEIGWGSDERIKNQLAKDPERQAELLSSAYALFLEARDELGIEGALWYTWRDPSTPVRGCGWCPSAGLFDRDFDPKPAWDAFTALTGGER